jgi:cyclase
MLIKLLWSIVSVPLTALGDAETLDDIRGLVERFRIIRVSVGSLFVFKGKYRAVLINYPVQQQSDKIIGHSKGINT